ncbi:unnamed protein product [Caenorhabditis brenneri]
MFILTSQYLKELLAHAVDFRENKLKIYTRDREFNSINIELGTFNQRNTEFPNFAEFEYPPPNENKVLKLAVFDEFCWFRGPGWRCGEMDKVENELEITSSIVRRSTALEEPVTESSDRTSIEHANSLKIQIYELKAENKVMSGELRELKRKLSTKDQKTDDIAEFDNNSKSSHHKRVDTTTNDEKSGVKHEDKTNKSDGVFKDDKKKENGGKSEALEYLLSK